MNMSVHDFVTTVLTDSSEAQDILPDKVEEVVAKIEAATTAKKSPTKTKDDPNTPLGRIKAAYDAQKEADEEEPTSKKAKSTMDAMVSAYALYKTKKNAELSDILDWNHQLKSGTKDVLMYRCIDGHVHGRLALCPYPHGGDGVGKLKLNNDMTQVVCRGYWDEVTRVHIPCDYAVDPEDAPRWLPWYVLVVGRRRRSRYIHKHIFGSHT
jgi:hypothetical protein